MFLQKSIVAFRESYYAGRDEEKGRLENVSTPFIASKPFVSSAVSFVAWKAFSVYPYSMFFVLPARLAA